jgi:hypothetical protein
MVAAKASRNEVLAMKWMGCVLALACLAACSSSGEDGANSFAPEPYTTVTSDTGKLRVEVRTAPDQPPSRGALRAQLVVVDDVTGTPRGDVSVSVLPWMAAMGHGTSVTPTVTPRGDGTYELSDLMLFMPGRWELRLTISGAVADSAAPILDVQ